MSIETGTVVPENLNKNVIVRVVGLNLGEEKKGGTVEWFSRELEAHTVIRSGGGQSGHHIVFPDGSFQMLSHYGSGVFEGANTHLKHMSVIPIYLYEEAEELEEKGVKNPLNKITIDKDCLIVTPFHGAYSRLHERSRGENKRGTVGTGASEAMEDARQNPDLSVRARDLLGSRPELTTKLEAIRKAKLEQAQALVDTYASLLTIAAAQEDYNVLSDESFTQVVVNSFLYLAYLVKIVGEEYIDEILAKNGAVVCEVSHGTLHHPRRGFVPNITQIDPTSQDVLTTLKNHHPDKKIINIGVTRSYMTRHGADPLVSFNQKMTDEIEETHNRGGSDWLGQFRNGNYDVIATRYALEVAGQAESFDGLVISFMDILEKYDQWEVVEAYEYDGEKGPDFEEFFEVEDGKITAIKYRPDPGDDNFLEQQAHMTEYLKKCRPVLKTLVPKDGKTLAEVFLDYVEEKTDLPVVATSHGPKAEDMVKRPSFYKLFNQ